MKTLGTLFYPSFLRTVVNISLNTVFTNILSRFFPFDVKEQILCSAYMHTCIHTHVHVYIHTYIRKNTQIHACIHTYEYVHTFIHSFIHSF